MPLGNKFRRLAVLMEPEVLRMREKYAQRVTGVDDARFDEHRASVTYLRNGAVVWQPHGERIGEWSADISLFKWWFQGMKFGEHGRTRLDPAYAEGKLYTLPELTDEAVTVESLDDARLLAHAAAQISRADGVLELRRGDRVTFIAVFDARETRASEGASSLRDTNVSRSGPPPWAAEKTGAPPFSVHPPSRHDGARAPFSGRSLPPPTPIDVAPDDWDRIPAPPKMPVNGPVSWPASAPTAPVLPVREPKRELFMPVAQCALGDVAATVPGFGQAMVVVRVEVANGAKGRFFVQLVAVDPQGDLIALDPSRALLDAAARMIADDARDGNGRWTKLAARLRPTERGAAVDVDIT